MTAVDGILLILLLCIITVVRASGEHLPPKILNDKEILVTDYEVVLVCEGTQPLLWTYVYMEKEERINGEKVEQVKPTQPGYTNASRLMLDDHNYQGYYYCHYNTAADLDDTSQADRVYVYLYAVEKSFAEPDTSDHKQFPHVVVVGGSLTLDCRPTLPNISVIVKHNDEVIREGVLEEPRIGYRLNNVSSSSKGEYSCKIDDFNRKVFKVTVKESLQPPMIDISPNSYPVVGYDMELWCAILDQKFPYEPVFNWTWPNPEARVDQNRTDKYRQGNAGNSGIHLFHRGFLKVYKADLNDSGEYSCQVNVQGLLPAQQTKVFNVAESKDSFVEIIAPSETPFWNEGENVTWVLKVRNFPPSTVEVISIPLSTKVYFGRTPDSFSIKKFENGNITVDLFQVTPLDFGSYIINVSTADGRASDQKTLHLKVRSETRVQITGVADLQGENTNVSAKCSATGYPLQDISWSYQPCPEGICVDSFSVVKDALTANGGENTRENFQSSVYEFVATQHANLRCQAGNASTDVAIRVTDIEKAYIFEYEKDGETKEVHSSLDDILVETDAFNLTCAGSKYDFSTLSLEFEAMNGKVIAEDEVTITDESTNFTFIKKIVVDSVTKNSAGSYLCIASRRKDSTLQEQSLNLKIDGLIPVMFTSDANLKPEGNSITKYAKDAFTFKCSVKGTGDITVKWTKDGKPLPDYFDQMFIEISDLDPKHHSGTYHCFTSNRKGMYSANGSLKLVVQSEGFAVTTKITLVLVLIGVVVLLGVVIVLALRVRKDFLRRRDLKRNVAILFRTGKINELNPDYTADEQAELLPYDHAWEVSRDRIQMGQQLGSGAFGRVVKAVVSNLEEGKTTSTVAVKMCKAQSDSSHVRALTLELKILMHLGKHLNVVNLVGANTSRVGKGELWILVEYCCYGSLLSFLLRHRQAFVNLIDPISGTIDLSDAGNVSFSLFSPMQPKSPASPTHPNLEAFESINTNSSGESAKRCRIESGSPTSLPVSGEATQSKEEGKESKQESPPRVFRFASPPRILDKFPKGMKVTESTAYNMAPSALPSSDVSGGEANATASTEVTVMSVNSQGSQYMYNMSTNLAQTSSFSTVDLVCWSWQVAEGMDYLTRRKVLHGDLAARNLLLARGNVVKISDFGLSRDIYKTDVYMKKTNDLMPVKWMSIEAIRDRIFSVESDVWAFGVTLWELFTLGSTPYPGTDIDYTFLRYLEEGYRMDMPKYANDDIYQLLLKCWQIDPENRPSFRLLANDLSQMLMPETTQHYNDKNDQYNNLNEERFKTETDYLEMLSAPDFKNQYKKDLNPQEGPEGGESEAAAGTATFYLAMQPVASFPETNLQQVTSSREENDPNYVPMSSSSGSRPPSFNIFSPCKDSEDRVFNFNRNSSSEEGESKDETDALLYRRTLSNEPSEETECLIPSFATLVAKDLSDDNLENSNSAGQNYVNLPQEFATVPTQKDSLPTQRASIPTRKTSMPKLRFSLPSSGAPVPTQIAEEPTHSPDSHNVGTKDENYINLPNHLSNGITSSSSALDGATPDKLSVTTIQPKAEEVAYLNILEIR